MKELTGLFIAVLAICAATVIGCKPETQTYSVRYKITVEIETPEGLKTGSAVREVTMRPQPELPQGGAHFDTKGEAVVIDLGKRGVAFAVMGTDDYWTFFSAFAPPSGQGAATTVEGMKYYQSVEGKKPLELKDRPLIVAFKDINDPKTVEAVYRVIGTPIKNSRDYSYQVEDNLEKRFGPGVRLKSINIERTDAQVTEGIQSYLSWIPSYYDKRLDGERFGSIEGKNRLANSMSAGSFKGN